MWFGASEGGNGEAIVKGRDFVMYVKTQRLVLKPFDEKDKDLAIRMFVNDQIKQTYMLPDFDSREAAEKLFYRLQELSLTEGRFVVGVYLTAGVDSAGLNISEDRLIGFMNDVEIEGDEIELGYVIDPQYHNQGYATEALQGMMEELFARGFKQVVTGAFDTNLPSIRVMEKCGMARLQKEDDVEYRGKVHRCVYYSAGKY